MKPTKTSSPTSRSSTSIKRARHVVTLPDTEVDPDDGASLVYPAEERIEGRRGKQEHEDEDDEMIEVVLNDRLGKKVRVKVNASDTVGDLKLLTAAQTGTRPEKLRIQKWYTVFKDHIRLSDYEVKDGMNLELYYN